MSRHHLLRRLSTYTSPSIDPTVRRLVLSRRLSEVEPHLEQLLSSAPSPAETLLSSVILSYSFAGMLPLSTRTFLLSPSLLSLNSLLTSYVHSGQSSLVPDLLSSLSSRHSISPDATTFSILIKALCDSGSPDAALPVLADMRSKGLQPTVVSYTPIIDQFYAAGRREDAERVWNEMVENGCAPDVAAYNVKALHYAHHGTPPDVLKVFDEMRAEGLEPDIVSYNQLITCYCKNGMFLDAKEVYRSLKGRNLRPNAATYRRFVALLCRNGDFVGAFEVCRDGIRKGKFPDIGHVKILVKGLVTEGMTEDAAWVVRRFKAKYPSSFKDAVRKMEEEVGFSSEES